MPDAKGDSKSSMQKIKGKLHEWVLDWRHGWPIRTYIMLYFVGVAITAFGVTNFFLSVTTPDSARYMLSALVQSQAAILAIVISLTLIVVQLTASAYSPRVVKIFKVSFGWQALVALYGISIFYGLLVLRAIRDTAPNLLTFLHISLEFWISLAYVFGILTFAMLIMYVLNVINFLNPATIINKLATDITKDSLLHLKEDPVQPIIDIVHGSIMRYDLATTRFGLKTLTDRIVGLIDTELAADDDHEAAVKTLKERFCTPMEFAGKLAVSRDDEKSTLEVIENLQTFGESIAKTTFKKLQGAAGSAAGALVFVGNAAEEKGLKEAVKQVEQSLTVLGSVSEEALETVNHEFDLYMEESLEEERKRASYQKFKKLVKEHFEEPPH